MKEKFLKSPLFIIFFAVVLAAAVFVIGAINRNEEFVVPAFETMSQDFSADMPHGEMSVRYIEFINDNLYDRFAFSWREYEAAAWLVAELEAMGHPPENIRVQPFYRAALRGYWPLPFMPVYSLFDGSPFFNLGIRPNTVSQNVVLTVPGQSARTIVVGAHYDSVLFPGASDNASGMALLLESAARKLNADNYFTIEYVFFGAEELGLYGALYYVFSLDEYDHENLKFMINADVLFEGEYLFFMAGYDRSAVKGNFDYGWENIMHGLNFGTGTVYVGENEITRVWDEVAAHVSAAHDVNLVAWPQGAFGPSDQLAFLPFGHTVMFLCGLVKTDEFRNHQGDSFMDFMMTFGTMSRVLHSPRDCFHYIEARWPGKIAENMRGFVTFLEYILLADYGG